MEKKKRMADDIRSKVEVSFDEYQKRQQHEEIRLAIIRKCLILSAIISVFTIGCLLIALIFG